MSAGKYKELVRFETKLDDKDLTGHNKEIWDVVIDNQQASIEPLVGREYTSEIGENSSVQVRIRLRYSSALEAIKTNDRIVDVRTGEVFDIVSPQNPHSANKEFIFMTEQKERS